MAPPPVTDLAKREIYTFTTTIFPSPTITVVGAVTSTITPSPTVTVYITDDDPNPNVMTIDGGGGLSGGAIAGIVIGCVLGILLLIWIIWSCCFGFGTNRKATEKDYYYTDRTPRRRSRNHSRHRHHHRHHSRSPYRSSRSTVRTIRTVSPAYVYDRDISRTSRSRSRSRY